MGYEYAKRRAAHDAVDAGTNTTEPAGKRAALRGLDYQSGANALSPVQLDGAGGGLSAGQVHAAAQQGIAGGGNQMPHAQAIQASFGKHDVSGVNAHVGGAASQACESMGANAYATGNAVAFKQSPDLHTAAHEAAHIVQQRAGVSLKGGVGASGDSHERHADAVADRVVQGKSAEGLLDTYAGGGGAKAPVQKKDVQFYKKGSFWKAMKRGGNSFKTLYQGGSSQTNSGIWSRGATKTTDLRGDADEGTEKKKHRQIRAARAGVIIGNILTAGLLNLPLFAAKAIAANKRHKAGKRAASARQEEARRKEACRRVVPKAITACEAEIAESGVDPQKVEEMLLYRLGVTTNQPAMEHEEWVGFHLVLDALKSAGSGTLGTLLDNR